MLEPLEDLSSVTSGMGVMKWQGTRYVLRALLVAQPEQASSLQGSYSVGCDDLAASDLGIVSSWQQSMEN